MELPVTNSVVAFGSVVNGGIELLGDGERNFAEPHGVNDAIPFVALNGSMAFGGENFRQPPGGNGVVAFVSTLNSSKPLVGWGNFVALTGVNSVAFVSVINDSEPLDGGDENFEEITRVNGVVAFWVSFKWRALQRWSRQVWVTCFCLCFWF